MKMNHAHFGPLVDSSKLSGIFKKIQAQYEKIPKTKCLFCPTKETVQADCCKHFSPPMYLGEFMDIFGDTLEWTGWEQDNLLIACYKYHLDPSIVKPCPLLTGTQCSAYRTRPFSCRMYGQYPEKEWNSRLERVSEEMGVQKENVPMGVQCQNIETEGIPSSITANKERKAFETIANLDLELFEDKKHGKSLLNEGLTYLTFDAHYLLVKIGPDSLEELTNIRELLRKKRADFQAHKIDKTTLDSIENDVKDFVEDVEKKIRR